MNREEATTIALKLLTDTIQPKVAEPLKLAIDATQETPEYYVFFYNTVQFLETKDFSHALAGNGPIAVSRENGAVSRLKSSLPWEEQL